MFLSPVIFILSASSLPLAEKLKHELKGEIHGPLEISGSDVAYEKATHHLAQLFKNRRNIVGICASGILIRALAPHLVSKLIEPAVLAVAEDGSSVVPLLGGHHGANHLANRIAEITNGFAAVTTASDVRLGFALDEPAEGYTLRNADDAKPAALALINGASLSFHRHPDESRDPLNPFHEADLSKVQTAEWTPAFAGVTIKVTEQDETGDRSTLIYHPQTLAIGIGCERGTSIEEVRTLIDTTLAQHNLAYQSITTFASIDVKQDEPALSALNTVVFFTADELKSEEHRISAPSAYVEETVGTPSVAEAAALAAAGPAAKLMVAKSKSKRATIAIAQSLTPILHKRGKQRGIVSVVGIGPGTPLMRSPNVSKELQIATDWVGYDLYLDLAKDILDNQTEHRFPLGGEEARCRHAIELAKQGKHVALVCSGDAGIYAMAALVYELIDREPCRVGVEVHPGISAFQMASAKAGAMIGHDFCCISLSDLLTPWETIVQRVTAAAEGDFVISFYNPRSLKRTDQIVKAFDILRPHRTADTPVVLASNLGRPEEKVRILRFDAFKPEDVDMLTLVMVGSSQSKAFTRGDGQTYAYTPRGYAKKMSPL
jgi:cobalt-precorrin 5A hydrolase / precorrin-3B C17-methyltransferase